MGKRGPRPAPSAVQKAKGTYRADRRGGEVQAEAEMPRAPSWLDRESRKYWRQIAPWLVEHGLLTRLDAPALALLCGALCEYVQAGEIVEAEARTNGVKFVATTDKGNVIQHPAVGVRNKAWERVVKLLREFGMTPSARAGLVVQNDQATKDPMTDLLDRLAGRRESLCN